jgi:hypothetical protein
MAQVFETYNASGELTMSFDGTTYGYIGKATLSSVGQASGGSITKVAGNSVYTIAWAADIIVALPVKANGTTALRNVSLSGGIWTITVHKGNGSFDANGFDIQEATEVYVFGAPVAGTDSIFMLYNANGVACADLSRRPLTYKSRVSIAANVLNWTLPGGVTTPAIVGTPSDRNITSVISSPQFINRYQARGWQLNTGTGKIERNVFQNRWFKEDGGATPEDTIRSIEAILIDANGLT